MMQLRKGRISCLACGVLLDNGVTSPCFQALPEGKEARSWDNMGAFRYVRSQLTAESFLAHDHTGGVHSTSVTRTHP